MNNGFHLYLFILCYMYVGGLQSINLNFNTIFFALLSGKTCAIIIGQIHNIYKITFSRFLGFIISLSVILYVIYTASSIVSIISIFVLNISVFIKFRMDLIAIYALIVCILLQLYLYINTSM